MLQFLGLTRLVGFVKLQFLLPERSYVTIQVRIWWESHWDTIFQKLARKAQEVVWSEGGGGWEVMGAGVGCGVLGKSFRQTKEGSTSGPPCLSRRSLPKVSVKKGTDNFHKWVPKPSGTLSSLFRHEVEKIISRVHWRMFWQHGSDLCLHSPPQEMAGRHPLLLATYGHTAPWLFFTSPLNLESSSVFMNLGHSLPASISFLPLTPPSTPPSS